MSKIFKKLNLKAQNEIFVVNAPPSFEPELEELSGVKILRQVDQANEIHFSLAFVTRQDELDHWIAAITAKARGDALVWFAYPKKSSRKYTCEFNRDSGWDKLGEAGFEAVRQVAIDEDWSALRFRRVEHIQSMKRDPKRAMSATGKARVSVD